MNTLADRLKSARTASRMSQAALAKAIGAGQSTIASIENGRNQSSGNLVAIANVLGVRPEWLAHGRGEMRNEPGEKPLSPGPSIQGKLPLISWVKAGELCESPDIFAPGDAGEWLDCPVKHGPNAYCLQVNGDSMDDGTASGYRDGEIIFVDPGVGAEPGNDVVVRTPDGKTTFKRLKRDEEGLYLLGLNGKRIIRVPPGTVFCGVVIFSGVKR